MLNKVLLSLILSYHPSLPDIAVLHRRRDSLSLDLITVFSVSSQYHIPQFCSLRWQQRFELEKRSLDPVRPAALYAEAKCSLACSQWGHASSSSQRPPACLGPTKEPRFCLHKPWLCSHPGVRAKGAVLLLSPSPSCVGLGHLALWQALPELWGSSGVPEISCCGLASVSLPM